MWAEEFHAIDLTRGYDSQWSLLSDVFVWLDLRLFFYYSHHQWLGPSSDMKNMLGLVVSRDEFEHQLAKSAQLGLEEELEEDEMLQLDDSRKSIYVRLKLTEKPDFPLLRVFELCGLDEFERSCVVIAYAAVLDRKYEKLFAYLQDDMTQKAPGAALATQLFIPKGGNMEQYLMRFRRQGFAALFESEALEANMLVLKPMVVEYLSSGTIADSPGLELWDNTKPPDNRLIVQGGVAHQLDLMMEDDTPIAISVAGAPGSGKRFQVKNLLSRKKARGVFADLSGNNIKGKAELAALEARLMDAYLCLYNLDARDEAGDNIPASQEAIDILCGLETGKNRVFLLSSLPIQARTTQLLASVEIPPLTEDERLQLFRAFLKGQESEGVAEELASKFHFTPRQIKMACVQAEGLSGLEGKQTPSSEELHAACYRQVAHKLDQLARRVPAAYSWDDVVLPDEQKKLMDQACGHIRYKHRVYHQWGFERKVSYGRGLSILFAGAPGTGKTMCAQIIARQLNMELYKINISQVVSKYIGETEKNLQAVFNEAKNVGCILFFDECDALFGKRSEVKDAHDRNANVEVAYLLQQIEEFDGVCILATNLIGNIDEAFMRRITYVVHFPFPDARMREEIYLHMLPAEAPVSEDIDWGFIAGRFELSGGHIKNIVLAAAFMAAAEDTEIEMRHLLRAAVGELRKNGIVVVREDLREYADMLDNRE